MRGTREVRTAKAGNRPRSGEWEPSVSGEARGHLTMWDALCCEAHCAAAAGRLAKAWPCGQPRPSIGPGHPLAGGAAAFSCWQSRAWWNFQVMGNFGIDECSRRYAAALVVYCYRKRRKSVL